MAESPTVPLSPSGAGERLLSLDVFRGLTIAGMILVNNPGSWSHLYPPLAHAEWHGWTPTDLIFPFFLFIVGVAMTLSFAKRVAAGVSRSALLLQVFRRSVIIFLLGLFLAGFPYFNLAGIRIPGVLQRIALCYLIGAVLFLVFRLRGRIAATAGLLVVYWLLMTFVPVPGYGAGVLSMEGNLAAWLDRALLGGHLWREAWDPEGLLSTLPAIATVLLGTLAGSWIQASRSQGVCAAGLLAGGAVCLLLGQILDLWFPVNKNLWTSSYTVFTGGFAALLLAVCYWVVDVRRSRWWIRPFEVFGMNAIAVFVLSGLMAKSMALWKVDGGAGKPVALKTWLYEGWVAPLASPVNASLIWAVGYVVFWLAAMWLLYQRRIFIKI